MNKLQLINKIYKGVDGINRKQAEKMLDLLISTIIEELKNGREVNISGFGTFLSKMRHSRPGVNPQNPSKKIIIPEVRVAKFRTGHHLKESLKGNR